MIEGMYTDKYNNYYALVFWKPYCNLKGFVKLTKEEATGLDKKQVTALNLYSEDHDKYLWRLDK